MPSSPLLTIAMPWEYRYRGAILFLSQPALALLGWGVLGLPWTADLGLPVGTPSALVAVVMAATGVILRLWGTALLTASVMAARALCTERLVTTGPFAYVRNPLYLGSILIYGGYGVLLDGRLAVGFVVFHWLRYLRMIRYEESLLRLEWGDAFDAYYRRVPRLFPRLTAFATTAKQGDDASPPTRIGWASWCDALLSNLIFLGLTAGYAATLWTGDHASLIPFEAAGFLLTGLYLLMVKRRDARRSPKSTHLNGRHTRVSEESTAAVTS